MYTFSSHLCMFQWFYIGKSRLKKITDGSKKFRKILPNKKKWSPFLQEEREKKIIRKIKNPHFLYFSFQLEVPDKMSCHPLLNQESDEEEERKSDKTRMKR